jgi:hypothetical protein
VRTIHADGSITDSEPAYGPQTDPLRSVVLFVLRSGAATTRARVVVLERTVVIEASPWVEREQVTPNEPEAENEHGNTEE